MISTRVQLCIVRFYIYVLFFSLYILNVVSKHVYIILIDKKNVFDIKSTTSF